MKRKTANDFDQELLNLFDEYVHGGVDRRGFIERAAKFAVGGVTAGWVGGGVAPLAELGSLAGGWFEQPTPRARPSETTRTLRDATID